ncbi:MAG: hypothetical protein IKW30_04525 [Lachnospiraceae bacterium]|nr:hypothetical protein [Lachnospiraceae bacterium]
MSIKEQILKSIEIIVDARLKGFKVDKTLPSVIVSTNDNGKYVISLNGNNYTVKCSLPNVELKVGQSVWVKIPNGNFNSKHICGIR